MPDQTRFVGRTMCSHLSLLVVTMCGTQTAAAQFVVNETEGDCPDFSIMCPMNYDPVECDDGKTYFNLCAATFWGCATGCESTGGSVLFAMAQIDSDETGSEQSDLPEADHEIDLRVAERMGASDEPEQAAAPKPVGGDCPDFSIMCPMVYDPVECDDGNTYFNLCAATYWSCATGCESTGGPILFGSAPIDPDENVFAQDEVPGADHADRLQIIESDETFNTAQKTVAQDALGGFCPDLMDDCPMYYPLPLAPPGACDVPSGECIVTLDSVCWLLSGEFQGSGTDCE